MPQDKIDRIKNIRIAAIIALTGNAVLAVLKVIFGLYSKSHAVIADGIDSSADVLISIITLVIAKIIAKPADEGHPWGHGRAETVATAFLSFVIFFMGTQILINSVTLIISGKQNEIPSPVAFVITLVSIAGKILLAWSQYSFGKRADSSILKANAKNMTSDVLVSAGVLAGLIISNVMGSAYADTIIALLIGAWVVKTAIGIFLEANLELMDGNNEIEAYGVIVEAANSVEGASNPHRARMRRVAGFWDIEFDIDVDPECTVLQAHDIATEVEIEIKRRIENVFDIMIHVEPQGDNAAESYGLSEEDMRGGK